MCIRDRYTVPRNTVNYQQYDAGNLVVLSELLFYNSEQYLVSSTTVSYTHLVRSIT